MHLDGKTHILIIVLVFSFATTQKIKYMGERPINLILEDYGSGKLYISWDWDPLEGPVPDNGYYYEIRDTGGNALVDGTTDHPKKGITPNDPDPAKSVQLWAKGLTSYGSTRWASSAILSPRPAVPRSLALSFGNSPSENAQAVAADATGNFVIGGYVDSAPVDFGTGPLSGNGFGLFLAKFSPSGDCLWAKRFEGRTPFSIRGIKIAGDGSIVCSGNFSGSINFGGSTLSSAGAADIFLVKFDSSGTHLWSKRFGSTDAGLSDGAPDLAIDQNDDIIIAGFFAGAVNFGGTTLGAPYTGQHSFVAKYDANGNHLWSKEFVCNADTRATGVAVDSGDNVLVCGYFAGSIDFGDGFRDYNGAQDMYIVKLDSAGSLVWAKNYGGFYPDQALAVAADSQDNVIVTGVYYWRTFIGSNLPGPSDPPNIGTFDVFLLKLSSGGTVLWSKSVGGGGQDEPRAIAIDSNDNILIAGFFQVDANFGGGVLRNHGGYDIFLAKYAPNGTPLWSERYGGGGTDVAYGLAVDGFDNSIIVGNFQGAVEFGPFLLRSFGNFDIFVYRRGP